MISVTKMDNVPALIIDEMHEFERSFQYPLGEAGSFRISHGEDYGRFFRSIGKCRIYLARQDGNKVLGSLAVVQRPLKQKGTLINSLYIGDLKLLPQAGGKVLYCMMHEAYQDFYEERQWPMYSIMMKGTRRAPSDYTGRLGLPKFRLQGKISIFRIPVNVHFNKQACEEIELEEAQLLAEALNSSDYSLPMTRAAVRSKHKPRAFALKNNSAVCVVEDTMASKRIFDECDEEIVSAHLSSFQSENINCAGSLIKALMPQLAQAGYPALFFAVPQCDAMEFSELMPQAQRADAMVYGRNLEFGENWQVNTSEI
ncbi:MAG: hypothetical protein HRT88_07565 [Lentisphaeraceae bacterium]|nr:hypothetical protein [Lentisphaeraceae bacterium]